MLIAKGHSHKDQAENGSPKKKPPFGSNSPPPMPESLSLQRASRSDETAPSQRHRPPTRQFPLLCGNTVFLLKAFTFRLRPDFKIRSVKVS